MNFRGATSVKEWAKSRLPSVKELGDIEEVGAEDVD